MNMQPSEAEAGFDMRLPPIVDTAVLQKLLEEEWAPASRNLTFRVGNSFGHWLKLTIQNKKKCCFEPSVCNFHCGDLDSIPAMKGES